MAQWPALRTSRDALSARSTLEAVTLGTKGGRHEMEQCQALRRRQSDPWSNPLGVALDLSFFEWRAVEERLCQWNCHCGDIDRRIGRVCRLGGMAQSNRGHLGLGFALGARFRGDYGDAGPRRHWRHRCRSRRARDLASLSAPAATHCSRVTVNRQLTAAWCPLSISGRHGP